MAENARQDERAGEASSGAVTGQDEAGTGRRSLLLRIATAVVMLGVLALMAFLGRGALFAFVALLVLVALFELFDGLSRRGRRVSVPFGLASGLALMVAGFLRNPGLIAVLLIATVVGAFLLALRPGRGETPASDVAWTVLGVGWVAGGGAAAGAILRLPQGVGLLIALVAAVALNDTVAYFVGSAFGKRKLAPSISQGKSWEGIAGGLGGSLAGGAVAGALVSSLGAAHGLAVGLLCGLLGPAGDLAESLFKREIGIKDSGRLLPGHGGLLDRLDALVFCAPAVLLYLELVVF